MSINLAQHTYNSENSNEIYTQKMKDRYQAEYDYAGRIADDDDPADYYVPIYATSIA